MRKQLLRASCSERPAAAFGSAQRIGQRQAKRQKRICPKCYGYEPRYHPEWLARIPSADIIFVYGNGDISFCDPAFTIEIVEAIREHNDRCPYKAYYFQSKSPEYFGEFLGELPGNVVLLTTLETNRDAGYHRISAAPVPSERYQQFLELDYPCKVVTVKPVMDFDVEVFPRWVVSVEPEYVWLGYNSRPMQVQLPEPSEDKLHELVKSVVGVGIEIRGKGLRGKALGLSG